MCDKTDRSVVYRKEGFLIRAKENTFAYFFITNLSLPTELESPSCALGVATKNNCHMLLQMFKSKIHRVKVTEANLNYVGSITIDEDLMEAANLLEGEKVQIVNNNNGERIGTYVIRGERGSGTICLNGAAARRAEVGDVVIIISYCWLDQAEAKTFKPVAVFPDDDNRLPQ